MNAKLRYLLSVLTFTALQDLLMIILTGTILTHTVPIVLKINEIHVLNVAFQVY